MSSVNDHKILGRLGQDPDVRYTQSNTAVANMSIATSQKYKDNSGETKEETQWHRVVAWGRTAEIAQEYLKKGDQVFVSGPVKTREWEDEKNGITRYTTETTALKLVLIGNGNGGGNGAPHPAGNGSSKNNQGSGQPMDGSVDLDENFDDIDDDLPF